MCLKEVGIFLVLCVTLAVANDEALKSPPEDGHYHGLNNPNYPVRELSSAGNVPFNGHHGHQHHNPHFPHESAHGSHENWEHKNHYYHGWHKPTYVQLLERQEGLERRRPLFYPYLPFHAYPYYPHAYPSSNDEEFETIESKAKTNYHGTHNPNFPVAQDNSDEINEQQRPFHHEPYNFYPNFPLNSDSSEESSEEVPSKPSHMEFPLPHILHLPHIPLPHEKPGLEKPHIDELNNDGPHNLFPHVPIDSDSSEESSEETPNRPFHLEFHLPHIPHMPHIPFPLHNKPDIQKPDIELNDEGSGEEEIIPLATAAKIPLQNDDDEADAEDDVVPVNFRTFLESRKSIAVNCDALNTPRYSCYNCYNYLVCKPQGGKIKACKDPYAPYCVNGICSDTPGPEC